MTLSVLERLGPALDALNVELDRYAEHLHSLGYRVSASVEIPGEHGRNRFLFYGQRDKQWTLFCADGTSPDWNLLKNTPQACRLAAVKVLPLLPAALDVAAVRQLDEVAEATVAVRALIGDSNG